MSHHSHTHDPGHHHGHTHEGHSHEHGPSATDPLSFEVKLSKILEHWVHHNEDHALNYRDWAAKARAAGFQDVANILLAAAELTDKMSRQFIEAKESIHSH